MSGLRAWIGLLVVVVFLVGAAAGVLWQRARTERPSGGAHAEYAALLQREFDLSPERMGHLRVILREYESDVARIERVHEAAYRAAVQPDLLPVNEEYNRMVRDLVLPAAQRARWDELAPGDFLNPKAH